MSLVDKIVKRLILTNFFGDGWGDQETFLKLLQFRKSANTDGSYYYQPLHPYDFQLCEKKSGSKHVRTYQGSFVSPLYSTGLLPPECKTCKFDLVIPRAWNDTTPAEEKRVCLHFAATGDHSFWRRSRFLAHPLAKEYSIGSVIVENPFYGSRKPVKQVRSGIRHVSDLFAMGSALISEGQFLLDWLQGQGYSRLGISGISLGGHNASLTAAVWGQPVATVPCLSWSTAAHTFSEGLVSSACMWNVLRDQLSPDRLQDIHAVIQKTDAEIQELLAVRCGLQLQDEEQHQPSDNKLLDLNYLSGVANSLGTRRAPDKITTLYMRLLVDEFSNLKHYPVLACPEAAIVVVANSDLYVPRPVEDDLPHIQEIWPGCEVRTVNGGHISSYLTHNHTFRRAIKDAFDKLDIWLEQQKGGTQ